MAGQSKKVCRRGSDVLPSRFWMRVMLFLASPDAGRRVLMRVATANRNLHRLARRVSPESYHSYGRRLSPWFYHAFLRNPKVVTKSEFLARFCDARFHRGEVVAHFDIAAVDPVQLVPVLQQVRDRVAATKNKTRSQKKALAAVQVLINYAEQNQPQPFCDGEGHGCWTGAFTKDVHFVYVRLLYLEGFYGWHSRFIATAGNLNWVRRTLEDLYDCVVMTATTVAHCRKRRLFWDTGLEHYKNVDGLRMGPIDGLRNPFGILKHRLGVGYSTEEPVYVFESTPDCDETAEACMAKQLTVLSSNKNFVSLNELVLSHRHAPSHHCQNLF